MRVLLTGGSGFIGRNLTEALGPEYEILAPRHAELDLFEENSVRKWFSENQVDAVIHSATKPGHRNAADPTSVAITNLHMFSNLFESARAAEVGKFLFLGSGSEFDMRNYRPRMKEESLGAFIPADDTGFSKYVCTRMMNGIPGYVNVRFFGIFGKYEDYAIRFISNAVCKAIFDLPITLRQDKRFDYTSVQDGVRAIGRFLCAAPESLRYNDYNVTPDRTVSLLEVARIVRDIAGKPDLPILVGTPGQGLEYSGNNGRFKERFPDYSFTPIEDSVKELYDWYESVKEQIDRNKLLVDK